MCNSEKNSSPEFPWRVRARVCVSLRYIESVSSLGARSLRNEMSSTSALTYRVSSLKGVRRANRREIANNENGLRRRLSSKVESDLIDIYIMQGGVCAESVPPFICLSASIVAWALCLPPLPRRSALQLCSPDCVSFSSSFFPSSPLKVSLLARSAATTTARGGQTK